MLENFALKVKGFIINFLHPSTLGIPAVIVVVTLVSSFDGYGTKNRYDIW